MMQQFHLLQATHSYTYSKTVELGAMNNANQRTRENIIARHNWLCFVLTMASCTRFKLLWEMGGDFRHVVKDLYHFHNIFPCNSCAISTDRKKVPLFTFQLHTMACHSQIFARALSCCNSAHHVDRKILQKNINKNVKTQPMYFFQSYLEQN